MHALQEREGLTRTIAAAAFGTLVIGIALLGLGSLGLLGLTGSCDVSEQEDLPRMESKFGFRGTVGSFPQETGTFRAYVVTYVAPESVLWKAGLRSGDRPASSAGDGSCLFSGALKAAASGNEGTFGVVRGLPGAGKWLTIKVPPFPQGSPAR